ncbi:hypothetical protein FEM48_Zijuj05G0019100 [Ziziphus jujuba var. spinosa]|uniref:Leucine-rich repeat-containing N-terminal plant-type domain-containing protein n=1 Tax=Ziziphus jujuba var. spinosa TaxID=714518 RepID=A0A978VC48_ZIZJJ|nr:hypothetical protein FEM48_Zijuj05G0019100 [Ziziphus jujuba var. spinosa]
MNCLDSGREALINFKNGLHDPENRLFSWKGSNCCQWWGISCDSNTGVAIAVDLHDPHLQSHDSCSRYGFFNLSAQIRPSLTKLKSLKHLDLSLNTFPSIPIPNFFEYLENLQYLNISNAVFTGVIPPSLGKLSNLKYLDLNIDRSLVVDDVKWILVLSL